MDKERIETILRIESRKGVIDFRHEAMATDLVLMLGGVDGSYAGQVAKVFFDKVDDLENKLSLYREISDVSRINLARAGEIVNVSSECIDCLEVAMKASLLTGGCFDVFVGEAAMKAKGERPRFLDRKFGCRDDGPMIEIDRPNRLVRKVFEGALLDLGGVGKGFALDLAMEEIEDWEVPIVMANFGGSTLLFRTDSEEYPWMGYLNGSGIESLSGGAISSSGSGFLGEHVIDPATGQGGSLWKRSFSRCASAGLADALSTGALLMDEERLEKLNENPHLAVAVEDGESVLGIDRFCSWTVE